MRFILGNSETENITEFLGQVQQYILEESEEWIGDKSLLENFKSQSSEEYFRFLYFYYDEEFVKYHLSSNFDIPFIDELDSPDHELEDNQILKEYKEQYQKYNFLIYERNNKTNVFIDIPSEKLFDWLENNLQSNEIEIHFAKKHDMLNKIQSIFKNELIKSSVQPNAQNKYAPSAADLNSSTKSNFVLFGFILAFFILLSLKSSFFAIMIIALANACYAISILYKLFLSIPFNKKDNIEDLLIENTASENKENKPIYTIFLPIYKEEKSIILQLISAIKNLNYPLHQLDIKILIEEDDVVCDTIISSIKLEYNFDIITVPNGEKYGHPKTKARACNYGFNFAKGEYVVIYDGDDIPHPDQLIRSIAEFSTNEKLFCIQCTLQPYNQEKNLLTKFFSIEFDLWYKILLRNINYIGAPITFGGTSNHFKTETLKNNLWDAYNVTEDADLGVRCWLNKCGDVKIIDLPTQEEAPSTLKIWINQRSRWIKGFIQTYFVHRKYKFPENDNRKYIFRTWINMFLGIPIFAQLTIIPVIFEFLVLKFIHHKESIISLLGTFTLISLVISCILITIPVLCNKDKLITKITPSIILFPLYTIILNIFSGYKAIWQFFFKPFYWEKTRHGVD